MTILSKAILIITLALCAGVIFLTELSRKEVKYDCRLLMGGWHPDIPQQVIKQCRGLI